MGMLHHTVLRLERKGSVLHGKAYDDGAVVAWRCAIFESVLNEGEEYHRRHRHAVIINVMAPVHGGVLVEAQCLKVYVILYVGHLIFQCHRLVFYSDVCISQYFREFYERILSLLRRPYDKTVQRIERVEKEMRAYLGFEHSHLRLVLLVFNPLFQQQLLIEFIGKRDREGVAYHQGKHKPHVQHYALVTDTGLIFCHCRGDEFHVRQGKVGDKNVGKDEECNGDTYLLVLSCNHQFREIQILYREIAHIKIGACKEEKAGPAHKPVACRSENDDERHEDKAEEQVKNEGRAVY